MLLINTRPSARAAQLSQSLHACMPELEILELPLLELTETAWSATLAQQFSQLMKVDVIVVVSPTAVELGMQGLEKAGLNLHQLQHVQWIAVGKTTAECLQRHGIESHVPLVETSEGMLSLPILQHAQSLNAVAFWRGLGGREFMMQQLCEKGIHVLNMVLYQRQCPTTTQTYLHHHLELLDTQPMYVILISSEASWLNWLDLIKSRELLNKGYYLVLGSRVYAQLKHYAQQNDLHFKLALLDNLQASTIQQVLETVRES